MKALAAAALVACALATTALPATSAPAINLAWNDCIDGATATLNKNFACDTNDGADVMFASYIAPDSIRYFSSVECSFEFLQQDCEATVAWWHIQGAGQCRNGAGVLNGDFASSTNACVDYGAVAVGGLSAFAYDVGNPGRSVGGGIVAVTTPNRGELTPEAHYYGLSLRISHLKTVGTDPCAGCSVPMCIRLTRVRIRQYLGGGPTPVDITTIGTRAYVTFQSSGDAICAADGCTPARRSTWGSVKALYR